MEAELRASLMVGSALHALRAGATAIAVLAQLDQAYATVRELAAGPFADALRAVLDEIDHCRHAGAYTSARLDTAVEAAVAALNMQTADGQA